MFLTLKRFLMLICFKYFLFFKYFFLLLKKSLIYFNLFLKCSFFCSVFPNKKILIFLKKVKPQKKKFFLFFAVFQVTHPQCI